MGDVKIHGGVVYAGAVGSVLVITRRCEDEVPWSRTLEGAAANAHGIFHNIASLLIPLDQKSVSTVPTKQEDRDLFKGPDLPGCSSNLTDTGELEQVHKGWT
ncbi:hypothetical protein EYC80_004016 [Monilinia laxa]|uniref:Uncharacterized protein n=1 Tax=Monilinia laxa TaxID=61186 RepID=A0A5N6KLT4_MONLA|nr:hypothetical protein EYC80_004016 [Monilinia laxa]